MDCPDRMTYTTYHPPTGIYIRSANKDRHVSAVSYMPAVEEHLCSAPQKTDVLFLLLLFMLEHD